MHVELLETKKRKEENTSARKPFIYKETDFPTILGGERKKTTGKACLLHIILCYKNPI